MARPEIFLSYSREDGARAKLFADALAAEGFEVWWDAQLRSGEAYDKVTETALHEARAVVVLWSSHSVDSRWVRAEATVADRNGTLMPAMIEPCRRPVMFELTQTADLSHWKGNRADRAWQAFVGDLRRKLADPARPPGEGSAAREPAIPTAEGRTRRIVLAAAIILLVLAAGSYFAFGAGAPGTSATSGSQQRVALLVRSLTASGSGDRNEAAVASGITDELINRLRRVPELQVGTALADGSAPSTSFENAYVVDGNVRSDGDQLRVTVRLAKASGEILWSDTFDRPLSDLFEVQDLIASSVANALSIPLDVGSNARSYGGTNNPEAFAAYVQGQIHALDFDQSVPVGYLERAVQLDPDFVKAYTLLAGTYGNRITLAGSEAESMRMQDEMDKASKQALEANPDIPESNISRAWYFLTVKDLAQAGTLMQRAAELDAGNDVSVRTNLAQFALTVGRNRKALTISESKSLIDPIYAENDPARPFRLIMNGRSREALDYYNGLVAHDVQGLQGQAFHVFWAYILLGQQDRAAEFAKGLQLPDPSQIDAWFSPDDGTLAKLSLPQLRDWADKTYGAGGQFGLANKALATGYRGNHRLAVDLLRIAFERPGGYALFYLWHPALEETRKSPEFAQLVTDLGFPRLWRASGDWGDFCQPAQSGGITCH